MAQAKTLTQAELDRVFAHIDTKKYAQRNRAIVAMSFYAGLRVAEIAKLTMADVVSPDSTIKNEIRLSAAQTKGKHPRVVFISTKVTANNSPSIGLHGAFMSLLLRSFIQITVCRFRQMAYASGFISFTKTLVSVEAAVIQAESSLLRTWLIKALA